MRILGEYNVAFAQHQYLLTLFSDLQDQRGIVWAKEGLAQMYKNTGQIREAYQLFLEARRIAEISADIRGHGYALKGLGEIASLAGEWEKGTSLLLRALAIFHASEAKTACAYTHKSLGDSYARSRRVEGAYRALH
jgi:tetratricopeptide (TPR) repeat protein